MFRMTEGYFTLDLRFIPRLPLNGPLTVNFFGTVVLYTYPPPRRPILYPFHTYTLEHHVEHEMCLPISLQENVSAPTSIFEGEEAGEVFGEEPCSQHPLCC